MYWSNPDTYYITYKSGDILEFWGDSSDISTFKSTYPDQYVVFAPGDFYYMDCGFGNKYGGSSWCDPFKTFWTLYEFEPSSYIDNEYVLGGELTAFSELFSDLNFHERIWPRAAGMADKLWSPLVPTDLLALTERLNAFATLLNSRGIPSTPITSTFCEINANLCFGKDAASL